MTTRATTARASTAERVRAGAAWLDANHPGWVERIDLASLDLSDCQQCILGQTFGDYFDAPIFEDDSDKFRARREAELASFLGFRSSLPWGWRYVMPADSSHDAGKEYAELTDAWRALIAARRDGGAS